MSAFLIVTVYLLAIAIPVAALYFFNPVGWYWHLLAIVAALGMGLMPTPAGWDTPGMSLVFGFFFTFMMIWGIGGLVIPGAAHHKREKHA